MGAGSGRPDTPTGAPPASERNQTKVRVYSPKQRDRILQERGAKVVEEITVKSGIRLNCVDRFGKPFTLRIDQKDK